MEMEYVQSTDFYSSIIGALYILHFTHEEFTYFFQK
ncbi:hypothetical protein PEDI_49920 [Persicobacter diffluens]|uniref:Uncharacterized protein n=1 Tax=Persicobacter diffluens TaxID=981 RepID=A0AAN4W4J8_9BACT|nr:hypothetical protein PEDI_49920 [Persicobacter diffluens]